MVNVGVMKDVVNFLDSSCSTSHLKEGGRSSKINEDKILKRKGGETGSDGNKSLNVDVSSYGAWAAQGVAHAFVRGAVTLLLSHIPMVG